MNGPNAFRQGSGRWSTQRQPARARWKAGVSVPRLRANSRSGLISLFCSRARPAKGFTSGCHTAILRARLLVPILVAALAASDALAERYLSLLEAQRVCFPQADQFEARTIHLTPEESKAIEHKSGTKIRALKSGIWLARQGTNLLGLLVVDHVLGKHEAIEYAVAVSPGGAVLQVEILEYREHYGGEIRNAKWREQFKGKSAGSKLRLNDDIYNISGATISCRNVTDGVRRVLAMVEVVRPHLLADGRMPDTAAKP